MLHKIYGNICVFNHKKNFKESGFCLSNVRVIKLFQNETFLLKRGGGHSLLFVFIVR